MSQFQLTFFFSRGNTLHFSLLLERDYNVVVFPFCFHVESIPYISYNYQEDKTKGRLVSKGRSKYHKPPKTKHNANPTYSGSRTCYSSFWKTPQNVCTFKLWL